MKRLSVCIAFIFSSVCAFAQTGAVQGFCTQGAVPAVTSGSSSANALQGVIVGCTVTVYLHGTTTLATIYRDGNNTPLANPFTANLAGATNAGGWLFYAATSQGVDVFGSGGGGNPACTTQPKCYAVATPLAVAAYPSSGGCSPNTIANGCTGATSQFSANGTLGIPGPVFNVIGYGATGATKSTSDFNITGGTSTGTSSSAPFTSATTGNIAIGLWGPTGVLSGTYTSGLTVTGYEGETCLLTFTGGSGSGATATLYLTGPNTIYSGEPFLVSAPGTGYASAPTSASVTSGTASCTGTATVSSVIGGTLAQSTLTYVNATTVTLSPGATSTVSSGLIWFGPNDCAAISSAVAAWNVGTAGELYFPSTSTGGFYMVGSACHLTVTAQGNVSGVGQCGNGINACGSAIVSGDLTGHFLTFTGEQNRIHDLGFINPGFSTSGGFLYANSSYLKQQMNVDHVSTLGGSNAIDESVGAVWRVTDSFILNFSNCGVNVNNTILPDAGNGLIGFNTIANQLASGAFAGICMEGGAGLQTMGNNIQSGFTVGLLKDFAMVCPSGGCGSAELYLENDVGDIAVNESVYLNGGPMGFGLITIRPGRYFSNNASPQIYAREAYGIDISGGTIDNNSYNARIVFDTGAAGVIHPYAFNPANTTPNSISCVRQIGQCEDFSQLPNLFFGSGNLQIGANPTSGYWLQYIGATDYLNNWNAFYNGSSWIPTTTAAQTSEINSAGWKWSYDSGLTPNTPFAPTTRLAYGGGIWTLPALVMNGNSATYDLDLSPTASDPNFRLNRPSSSLNNMCQFMETAGTENWSLCVLAGGNTLSYIDRSTSNIVFSLAQGGPANSLVVDSSGDSQIAGAVIPAQGVKIAAGTMILGATGKVIYGSDATNGYAEVNENNTGLSRVCTAANGICAGAGVSSINSTAGAFTFSGSGVSCTGTTCTFSGSGSGIGSITWSVPAYMSATPSTISASGTQNFGFNSQTANQVFAGPGSGSAALPGFRALVSADIPNNAANTSGNAGTATLATTATNLGGTTTNSIPWQSGSATTSYISPVNSAVLVTSAGGVPSESTTLPSGLTIPGYATTSAATTVNSQTCTLGSTCTIPFQTNSGGNTSQAGINLETSTTNAVGLTVTPTNSATNVEKFEITGTYSGGISSSQVTTGLGYTPANCTAGTTGADCLTLTSGLVPTANLGSGSATSSTFLRGNQTYSALASGDIPNNAANTTGSAAKWTTARNLAGNSVDGSANVAFANKVILQGTTDAGFSSAQFLGALGTGIVKNTTTTGVLSIAAAADVYGLWSGSCSSSTYLRGDGACATPSGSSGLSGMTAGQVPIAATAATVTSSEALAGSGTAIVTGPTSSTSGDAVVYTGTSGQTADAGFAPSPGASCTTVSSLSPANNGCYNLTTSSSIAMPAASTFTIFTVSTETGATATYTSTTLTSNSNCSSYLSGTTLTLPANETIVVKSDGTNIWAGCSVAPGAGTVTSIATTGPITGGTITGSGTIACATCVVATVNPSAGLLRVAGSTQTATGAELSGDATTSGSNAVTVVGLKSVPFCTGYTPTNGQLVQYTTGGSPNPCYTSATPGLGGDTISSPNSTLAVGGTVTATTLDLQGSAGEIMAGATPALTYTPTLGKSGTAGTLALFPASGNFTTTLGTAATANNTFLLPAAAPTNLHLFYAAVSGTTTTLTDTGYAYNSIPNGDLANSSVTFNGVAVSLGSTGNINTSTSGDLLYSGGSGAALNGTGDFTFATHTLSGGASAILDLHAAPATTGLLIPSAAGAIPTADGQVAVNTTTHANVHGSNGTTIVEAAAATGTNTLTACSAHNWVSTISSVAAPTCTQPAVADVTGAAPTASPTFTGTVTYPLIATTTNCAAAGSAASPSLVACSAAPSGSFSCATNASTATCIISTTAVTANSRIFVQPSSAEGANLSVTCNTTADTGLTAPRLSAKSAGTSFTINLGTFSTNPMCFNYWIVN